MKPIAQTILILGMMALGLVGTYYKVDYSGWAIFIAVLAAFGT